MSDVILLSHGFQSEYEIGFANGLARNGLSVTLLGSDSTLLDRAAPGVEVINLRGSQDSRRSRLAKALNIARYIVSYLSFILARRNTPVHQIGLFSTGSSWLALMEAWLTRCCTRRYLMTVHNLLPHDQHTAANKRIFRGIYGAPAALMVHTQRVAALLVAEFGVDRQQIYIVGHGFDRPIPPDQAMRQSERSRLGLAESAPLMLFFGQVVHYKGLDLLLDAFEQMTTNPSTRLVIAGHCRDPKLRADLREAIAKHPWRARIQWFDGFVPDAQVAALMQAADCIVMPYRYIDQSGVLFMALSAGLPVVATDVGSIAETVRPGFGEVVPLGNSRLMAQAIERVLATGFNRAELLAAASCHEWRNTVRPLRALYADAWQRQPATEQPR